MVNEQIPKTSMITIWLKPKDLPNPPVISKIIDRGSTIKANSFKNLPSGLILLILPLDLTGGKMWPAPIPAHPIKPWERDVRWADASCFAPAFAGPPPTLHGSWCRTMNANQKQPFSQLIWRALRLRCPWCGRGKLFRNWIRMRKACSECEGDFEREPGFYLGSIYFNYGLTALIVAVAYPLLLFTQTVSSQRLMMGTLAFAVCFPIWFFRYARSLWLGFDQWMDPDAQRD